MIEIAQIGTIPIRDIRREVWAYEQDVRPLSDPDNTLTDGDVAFPSQQYAIRETEREIDGVIMDKNNNDPRAMLDELTDMTGKPSYVVAVYPYKTCAGIQAIWLFAPARIERVRGEPDDTGAIRVRVDLRLSGAYKPMNRLLWSYVNYDRNYLEPDAAPSPVTVANLTPFPTWDEYIAEYHATQLYYWRYLSERGDLMLNPDNWDFVVNYLPNEHLTLGEYEQFSDNRGIVTVWQDSTFWNFRPYTLFAIKGLGATYDVTIDVYRPESIGGDEAIVLDVSALDAILTGETGLGLQTTDIVIFGDVNGRAFVVRSGAIVAYCTSIFSSYNGEVMAAIALNANQEYRIDWDYALTTLEWASMIIWRKTA